MVIHLKIVYLSITLTYCISCSVPPSSWNRGYDHMSSARDVTTMSMEPEPEPLQAAAAAAVGDW